MFRAYLFLFMFIPITFIIATTALISTLFDASGRYYAFHARLWARLLLFLASTKVNIEGTENLPDSPVIFMSNHQSNFDILALLAKLPCQINWIAKKELFDIPIFGSSMRRGGYIPLDRTHGRSALKSMDNAASMIRAGKNVVMFPEGTRSKDLKLLPFKRGGFLLAIKAAVPVIPVTINGSGKVNPANRTELYPGQINIILHKPIQIPTGKSKTEAEAILMEKVQNAISSVLEY